MRISHLCQRLRALDAKPCHEDRVLRAWCQVRSHDKKGSPAETFYPAALRDELPAIEAELNGLARLKSEHVVALSPALSLGSKRAMPCSTPAGEGADVARLLVELHDGQMVESVLLPRGGLCVSTQVGCAVGCVFCMSGRDGLQRQLGSAEIVAQVVLARKRRKVSKVVFMGMGEPAHNLDNVLEAIDLLGTQGNIGHKNLVLSTVGDVRVFERLMDGLGRSVRPELAEGTNGEGGISVHGSTGSPRTDTPLFPKQGVKPALALSLHSTDDELRAKLLPNAPRIPVEELVGRCEAYARATHYPTQYQWTLIEGVNDGDAELERIARLLKGKYAVLNFIPFNDVDGLPYRRPSAERIADIAQRLNRQGIYTRIRDSAGQEVEGACGQLRSRAERMKRATGRPARPAPLAGA